MINDHANRPFPKRRFAVAACSALLLASACASDGAGDAGGSTATSAGTASDTTATGADVTASETTAALEGTNTEAGVETEPTELTPAPDSTTAEAESATSELTAASDGSAMDAVDGCDDIAAQFVTRGSANADLDDPEVSASCDGDTVVVTSNGIPDYTYVETSPGQPTDRDHTFIIPSSPTMADSVTEVPLLGTAAVSLGGIPIYGPTEGTGGDVESLPGILSDCGSHNGPTGFHIHLILTSAETDCLFTPEEVAAEPQLVGYAFDGFPIYTGIDQYTSSWQLTDETLFATDTWAAHTYVEGSGDLDQCNGLTDADGNYAYYTTATFPYVLGCYVGVADLDAAGGGGGGGAGADGERPARPEGDAADETGAARPARPERGAERPERPAGEGAPREDEGE